MTRAGFHAFHVYVAQHAPDDLWSELKIFGFDRRLTMGGDGEHNRAVVVESFRVRCPLALITVSCHSPYCVPVIAVPRCM